MQITQNSTNKYYLVKWIYMAILTANFQFVFFDTIQYNTTQ